MKKTLMILILISISLTFLVFSIEINSYNENYYTKKFKEHNVEEVTGKNLNQLKPITKKLILYLKGGDNDLLRPHYNGKEILHMEDVKSLFNLARIIKYIGILIIILGAYYLWKSKALLSLAKTLFYGIFINYILISIIGVLSFIDFNKYFTYFHLLFFTNDLWLLDPRTDLLIQMLPEEFFIGMAIRIVITFVTLLAFVQVISFIYIRKKKQKLIMSHNLKI